MQSREVETNPTTAPHRTAPHRTARRFALFAWTCCCVSLLLCIVALRHHHSRSRSPNSFGPLQKALHTMLRSLTTKKDSVKDVRLHIQNTYTGIDLKLASELLLRRAKEEPTKERSLPAFKKRLSVLYVIDNCIGKAAKQAHYFERVVVDVVRTCVECCPEQDMNMKMRLRKVVGEPTSFGAKINSSDIKEIKRAAANQLVTSTQHYNASQITGWKVGTFPRLSGTSSLSRVGIQQKQLFRRSHPPRHRRHV